MSGADQAAAYLAQLSTPIDRAVSEALTTHGRDVAASAASMAPGSLGQAIGYKVTDAGLTVDAGAALKPAAYTMHATAMGKTKGYMTFRVAAHTRRGSHVTAYKAVRKVPNRPYLFMAWERMLGRLVSSIESAVARGVS